MMKLNKDSKDYIKFRGKKYSFDINGLRKVCLTASSDGGTKEVEITQVYEYDENGIPIPSSKVDHETKVAGNPQNDMILYDIVKLFILRIMENEMTEEDFNWDFSTSIAVNTLINWGVLIEVE